MTKKEAIQKIKRYCAYQDRCQSETRKKLYVLKLSSNEVENILCSLIEENFIDEERFAKNFVRGKFQQKKWGKIKIKQHLKLKEISDYCIKRGFEEITREEYLKTLNEILQKKSNKLIDDNVFRKKQKLAKYAVGKGFESDLVWDLLRD